MGNLRGLWCKASRLLSGEEGFPQIRCPGGAGKLKPVGEVMGHPGRKSEDLHANSSVQGRWVLPGGRRETCPVTGLISSLADKIRRDFKARASLPPWRRHGTWVALRVRTSVRGLLARSPGVVTDSPGGADYRQGPAAPTALRAAIAARLKGA
jgi:hypothetical protein